MEHIQSDNKLKPPNRVARSRVNSSRIRMFLILLTSLGIISFVCPNCGHHEYYFVSKRKLYQCRNCRHQASLTAGTVTAVIIEASTNGEGIGYAKMTVVEHVDSATIGGLVKADVKENQTIKTDGFRAYTVVGKNGHTHRRELVKGKKAHEVLT